jgi:CRISPR-associated Cas5-like protein
MRLAAEEVEPIMELVQARLEGLYETQVNLGQAELLFRVLWRYKYPYQGRPSYPEPVTWSTIRGLLENGPFVGSSPEPTEEEMKARFEEEGR